MQITKFLITIAAGYLLGSFCFSVILSKCFIGKDIRSQGSGNAGATNMARVFGAGAGAATLAMDMFKCGLALLLGRYLLGDQGVMAGGLSCLIGHCFPVFHHFKGGKGVASGAACALAFGLPVFGITVAVFLAVALSTKKVSAASVSAAVVPFISTFFIPTSVPLTCLAVIAFLIIAIRHRENIKRLIAGTEKDFHFGKSKK